MIMARHNSRNTNSQQSNRNDKRDQEDEVKPSTQTPTPRPEPKTIADEEMPSTSRQDTSPQQESANRVVIDREQEIHLKPTDEMMKAAEVVASMKISIAELSKALEAIGSQAALMTSLHESMKIQEEVKMIQRDLQEQITRQTEATQKERDRLTKLIKESLEENIRERLSSRIRDIIQDKISRKVAEELRQQISDDLKTQASQHSARIRRIDLNLHNTEVKRHNAHVKKTELLRPLRIPNPKAVEMSRSSSGNTVTPSTAGTLQTPDTNSLLLSGISPAVNDDDWSSWPMSPLSIQQLFKMDNGTLRQLLQDLGDDVLVAKDDKQRAQQLNRAISLTGASYQVIPTPVSPVHRSAPPRRQAVENASVAPLSPLSTLMLATLY